LNRHVHLRACVTDGVFSSGSEGVAFLPSRPISPADLTTLTERVRHRLVCWFRRRHLIDGKAAADMLTWQNSGFSIDAGVRISLTDRDVPGVFQKPRTPRPLLRPPHSHSARGSSRGQIRPSAPVKRVRKCRWPSYPCIIDPSAPSDAGIAGGDRSRLV
jgi:hypothetical protein